MVVIRRCLILYPESFASGPSLTSSACFTALWVEVSAVISEYEPHCLLLKAGVYLGPAQEPAEYV